MTEQTFLVEIGTEELPPKALRTLAQAFADHFKTELEGVALAHGEIRWFATPRRLALQVSQLATRQADRQIEKRGPAVAQAFDAQGEPTKAARGWASGCGITVEQAQRLTTDKGEWLFYQAQVPGVAAEQLLPGLVSAALARLPIPKAMRWGASDIEFIRPVHTVTLLLGQQLIAGSVLGIESARTIKGHRFMGEAEMTLQDAAEYQQLLAERGKVIADYEARKTQIKQQIEQVARQIGGHADLDDSLLEEVTSLVEW
ncbi:MAG: glycine--tRNA ligase subunit beta, partial [Enterobacteriaceae bacterium]